MKKKNVLGRVICSMVVGTLFLSSLSALPVSASEDSTTTINIVHTNDIHGYFTATDRGNIGFAKLKTFIDEQGADLTLDAGDTYHGQSFATVEKGMSIALLMKEVGYDAMTLGNHDWSYGKDRLLELEQTQSFPILASNVVTQEGDLFFDTPYVVKEIEASDGSIITVGILGVIDDSLYSSTVSDNVSGLTFEEESESAQRTAEVLRNDENCDMVIAITHQADPKGFVENTSGIDIVIAGHEHKVIDESYTDAEGKSVKVVETGSHFNNVGMLSVSYDTAEDKISGIEEKIYSADDLSELEADTVVADKISEIQADEEAILGEVIGKSELDYNYSWEDIRVEEQKIGRIITAAYLDRTGADVAFENAGGIRSGISKGDITYQNLISISPYANTLITKQLTGRQLISILEKSIEISIESNEIYELQKQAIENGEDPYQYNWPDACGSYMQVGGIKAEVDISAKFGSRIVNAKIGGEAIDPDRLYTVATNNYAGEDSYYEELSSAGLLKEYGTCEEALKTYFAKGSFSEAAEEANLTAYVPEPEPEPEPESSVSEPDSVSQPDSSDEQNESSSYEESESDTDTESDTKSESDTESESDTSSSKADTMNSASNLSPNTGIGNGVSVSLVLLALACGTIVAAKKKK